MFYIEPLTISDGTSNGLRTSTNATDEVITAWAAGTNFANVGDKCAYLHGIYQSRIAANTGHQPTYRTTDDNWAYIGDLNSWAMFDDTVETQTTNNDTIQVRLTPGAIANGLFLGNCDCNTITVVMVDPVEGVVYNRTINMRDESFITNALTWLTLPILKKRDVALLDLPFYPSAYIDITIENTGSVAKCGLCKSGLLWTIGDTQYGASVGLVDYSKVSTNDFGQRVLTKRGYAKQASFPLKLDSNMVDGVNRFFQDRRQVPGVYIGAQEFESTMVYGTFQRVNTVIALWGEADCSVDVQGFV